MSNLTFGSPQTFINFTGVVTFTSNFNPTVTVISGQNVTTGTIQSANYTESGGSATAGTKIDLNTGLIRSKEFSIDTAGNASFSGDITAGGNIAAGATVSANAITTGSLDASLIDAGTLNADRIQTNTLNVGNRAIGGSIGRTLGTFGNHTMSNTGTAQNGPGTSGTSSSFNAPELLGGSVITLSIPPTGSVETVTYIITLTANPFGNASSSFALFPTVLGTGFSDGYVKLGNTMSNLCLGVATSSSYTSAGAINSSPFAASGSIYGIGGASTLVLNTISANGTSSPGGATIYQNKIYATSMAITLKFDVQTSTTGTVSRYIYPWGGLAGVASPGMNFGVTVTGLLR